MLYLVTELCACGDFGELHTIENPEEIRMLFRDLVLAVAYCHDKGIAHRDLKFENCLLTKQPAERHVAKVIDFGLSAIRRPGDKAGQWLNDQLGTRYFVAPEVVDINKPYGVKCDCWSMGVMLYIVLTDEHPCCESANNLDTAQLFRKILWAVVREQPLKEAQVAPAAVDLIKQLLVKDPDKRMDAKSALNHEWLKPRGGRAMSTWRSQSILARKGYTSRKPDGKDDSGPLDTKTVSRLRSFGTCSRFEKALLTLVAHQSTSREVEDMRSAFMHLDKDGAGSLSKHEIKQGLKDCGHAFANEDFDSIFDSLDADGSGKVHYTEWLAATMKPSSLASDKAIKAVYNFFDIERNGKVSKEELLQVLGCDKDVRDVMDKGDLAGDGYLTEEEFKVLMRDIARKLDSKHRHK